MGCFSSRPRQPDKTVRSTVCGSPFKYCALTPINLQNVPRNPADVKVRGRHINTTGGEHAAVLSYDAACSVNYISSGLVTNFLGEEIHPLVEEKDLKQAQSLSPEAVKGFVDLEWRMDSNTQDWHMARFLVTTSPDPIYDLVLGNRDGRKYGMDKAKA
ncbi:hypothetical protein DE146DRAFT_142456 [Phaeosphaeria sp. MPI-PUGE-AT-0046c]|nr:hypothetical protein DE146DRAFT_142456 [Phaeosphaeria sp. MPI-PUGE-AT-0046c]